MIRWMYSGWFVVFKFEYLIHIDLSRRKNLAIARSYCTYIQTKIQGVYGGSEINRFILGDV